MRITCALLMLPLPLLAQAAAQRELITQLGNALDARRQRIFVSRGGVGWVKWTALMLQAICTLVTIALVHCDNRVTARLALGLFATAVAVSMVLITAYDRPFTGRVGVRPSALLQVQPDSVAAVGVRPSP